MGEYDISFEEGYVRIKVGEEYEYIVSEELFGEYSKKATRLFDHAYRRGQGDLRRNIRSMLNT